MYSTISTTQGNGDTIIADDNNPRSRKSSLPGRNSSSSFGKERMLSMKKPPSLKGIVVQTQNSESDKRKPSQIVRSNEHWSKFVQDWQETSTNSEWTAEERSHRLKIFARYCPRAVAASILINGMHISQVKDRRNIDPTLYTPNIMRLSLPQAQGKSFFGIVLLADISGFTQLGADLAAGKIQGNMKYSMADDEDRKELTAHQMQKRGADSLASILSGVFSQFISIIRRFGGDVIKFAGDALLSVFRPENDDEASIAKSCLAAARAAWEMEVGMSSFTEQNIKLSLHSGIACGWLKELHFGGHLDRWEYMVAGQAISHMGKALDSAKSGQIVLHQSIQEYISNSCVLSLCAPSPKKGKPIANESSKDSQVYLLQGFVSTVDDVSDPLPELIRFVSSASNGCDVERGLASYIPRPVLAAINAGKQGLIGERRQVSIIFINLPGFQYDTARQISQNQIAFLSIQETLNRYDGTLRQLIQDDKGTVAIIAFGLPYCSHEDDPIRALQAGLTIHSTLTALQMPLSVGITTGGAFCGSVGDETRCEYAIVGDVVNLSARLMVAAHDGVLCDGDTESAVNARGGMSHGINFERMEPIAVKGRRGLVRIFRPIFSDSRLELEKPVTLMLGRREERERLKALSLDLEHPAQLNETASNHPPGNVRVVVINGTPGMGKTRLIQELQEIFEERGRILLYFTARDMSATSLLSTWNQVIPKFFEALGIEKVRRIRQRDERFNWLESAERNAVNFLLKPGSEDVSRYERHLPSLKSAIRRMICRVVESTGYFALVVERIEKLDALSWHILEDLCLTCTSIIAIVLSTASTGKACTSLMQNVKNSRYFMQLELGSLGRRDVEALMLLRLRHSMIPTKLLDTVCKSTDGNPYMIERLSTVLRTSKVSLQELEDGAGTLVGNCLQQLLTSRIDTLDPSQQEVLKCASVLGQTFSFRHLLIIAPYAENQLLKALESLEQLSFIGRDTATTERIYFFRQNLMRPVLYELLSKADIIAYHSKVVYDIEKERADILSNPEKVEVIPDLAADLGHHFEKAGRRRKAVLYYQLAADAAFALQDFSSASKLFTKTLNLLKSNTTREKLIMARCQRQIAESNMEAGDFKASVPYLEAGLQLLGIAKPSASTIRWKASKQLIVQNMHRVGAYRSYTNQRREAELERAKILNLLSRVTLRSDDKLMGLYCACSAANCAERADDTVQRVLAYTHLLAYSMRWGNRVMVHKYYRMSVLTLQDWPREGLLIAEGHVRMKLANIEAGLCRMESSLQLVMKANEIYSALDSPVFVHQSFLFLAEMRLTSGLLGEAKKILRRTNTLELRGNSQGISHSLVILAAVNIMGGNLQAGTAALEQVNQHILGEARRSLAMYKSCQMVYHWLENHPSEALSLSREIQKQLQFSTYTSMIPYAWAVEIMIADMQSILENVMSTAEAKAASIEGCQRAIKSFEAFSVRIPVAYSKALLYQGLFAHIAKGDLGKASFFWMSALEVAMQNDIAADQIVAHTLLGSNPRREAKLSLATKQWWSSIPKPRTELRRMTTEAHLQSAKRIKSRSGIVFSLVLRSHQGITENLNDDPNHKKSFFHHGIKDGSKLKSKGNDLRLSSDHLIGRTQHISTLLEASRHSSESTSQNFIVLYGPRGIGKSAVLRALRKEISGNPYEVFEVWGERGQLNVAYHVIIRLLRLVVKRCGRKTETGSVFSMIEALLARFPQFKRIIAVIVKVLFSPCSGRDIVMTYISQFARTQLLVSAFVELIRSASCLFPVCILLYNCQWIDEASWQVLESLEENPSNGSLMFLAIDSDLQDISAVRSSIPHARVLNSNRVAWMYIEPLDRDNITSIALRTLNVDRITPTLSLLLMEKSLGNPYICIETLKTLQILRLLEISEENRARLREDVVDVIFALPATITKMLQYQLQSLPQEHSSMLKLASTVGYTFSKSVLQSLVFLYSEMLTNEFRTTLDELRDSNWISERRSNSAGNQLGFAHVLAFDSVYESMSENEKRKLHLCLKEFYDAKLNNNPQLFCQIAKHCEETNHMNAAVKYFIMAADYYEYIFHAGQIVNLYNKAISLEAQTQSASEHDRATWRMKIGIAQMLLGKRRDAHTILDRALNQLQLRAPTNAQSLAISNVRQMMMYSASKWLDCCTVRGSSSTLEKKTDIEVQALYAAALNYYAEYRIGAALWCALRSLRLERLLSSDPSRRCEMLSFCYMLVMQAAQIKTGTFRRKLWSEIDETIWKCNEIASFGRILFNLAQGFLARGSFETATAVGLEALEAFHVTLADDYMTSRTLSFVATSYEVKGDLSYCLRSLQQARNMASTASCSTSEYTIAMKLYFCQLMQISEESVDAMEEIESYLEEVRESKIFEENSELEIYLIATEAVLKFRRRQFALSIQALQRLLASFNDFPIELFSVMSLPAELGCLILWESGSHPVLLTQAKVQDALAVARNGVQCLHQWSQLYSIGRARSLIWKAVLQVVERTTNKVNSGVTTTPSLSRKQPTAPKQIDATNLLQTRSKLFTLGAVDVTGTLANALAICEDSGMLYDCGLAHFWLANAYSSLSVERLSRFHAEYALAYMKVCGGVYYAQKCTQMFKNVVEIAISPQARNASLRSETFEWLEDIRLKLEELRALHTSAINDEAIMNIDKIQGPAQADESNSMSKSDIVSNRQGSRAAQPTPRVSFPQSSRSPGPEKAPDHVESVDDHSLAKAESSSSPSDSDLGADEDRDKAEFGDASSPSNESEFRRSSGPSLVSKPLVSLSDALVAFEIERSTKSSNDPSGGSAIATMPSREIDLGNLLTQTALFHSLTNVSTVGLTDDPDAVLSAVPESGVILLVDCSGRLDLINTEDALEEYSSLSEILLHCAQKESGKLLSITSDHGLFVWPSNSESSLSALVGRAARCAQAIRDNIEEKMLGDVYRSRLIITTGKMIDFTVRGVDSSKSIIFIGPPLIEAFRISRECPQSLVLSNDALKLLRLVGRIEVSTNEKHGFNVLLSLKMIDEFPKYASCSDLQSILQQFKLNYNMKLLVNEYRPAPSQMLDKANRGIVATVFHIVLTIPFSKTIFRSVVTEFMKSLRMIRLAAPGCLHVAFWSTGDALCAQVVFEALSSEVGLRCVARIMINASDARSAGNLDISCRIGVGTGQCNATKLKGIDRFIVTGEAAFHARVASEISSHGIIFDEEAVDAVEELVVVDEVLETDFDQAVNVRMKLRAFFRLRSMQVLPSSMKDLLPVVFSGRRNVSRKVEDLIKFMNFHSNKSKGERKGERAKCSIVLNGEESDYAKTASDMTEAQSSMTMSMSQHRFLDAEHSTWSSSKQKHDMDLWTSNDITRPCNEQSKALLIRGGPKLGKSTIVKYLRDVYFGRLANHIPNRIAVTLLSQNESSVDENNSEDLTEWSGLKLLLVDFFCVILGEDKAGSATGMVSELKVRFLEVFQSYVKATAPTLYRKAHSCNTILGTHFPNDSPTRRGSVKDGANMVQAPVAAAAIEKGLVAQLLYLLFEGIAEDRSIIFLIDDIDRIDAPSRWCVVQMCARLGRAYLVATVGSIAVPEVEGIALIHELQPMNETECIEFAAACMGSLKGDIKLAQYACKKSDGMPARLFEVARTLLTAQRPDSPVRRGSVRAAFSQFEQGLSQEAKTVINVFSVAGIFVHVDVALKAFEDVLTLNAIDQAIAMLVDLKLVEYVESERKTLRFTSQQLQKQVYNDLDADLKRKYHRLYASCYETREPLDPELLAHHWRMARNYAKSLMYQVRMARKCMADRRIDDSIEYYKAAVSSFHAIDTKQRLSRSPTLKKSNAVAPIQKTDYAEEDASQVVALQVTRDGIYRELAHLYMLSGNYVAATDMIASALADAGEQVKSGRLAVMTAISSKFAGKWMLGRSRKNGIRANMLSEEAGTSSSESNILSKGNKEQSKELMLAELYLMRAWTCIFLRRRDEGLCAAVRAVDLATKVNDKTTVGRSRSMLASYFSWYGWNEIARTSLSMTSQVTKSAYFYFHSILSTLNSSSVKQAMSAIEPHIIGQIDEDPFLAKQMIFQVGILHILIGHWRSARSSFEQGLSIALKYNDSKTRRDLEILVALTHFRQGQFDISHDIVSGTKSTLNDDRSLPIIGQGIACLVFLRTDRFTEARAWFAALSYQYLRHDAAELWYDVLDHIVVADFILAAVDISEVADDESGVVETKRRSQAGMIETKNDYLKVFHTAVKRLKSMSISYPFTKGIYMLYQGCLFLIEGKFSSAESVLDESAIECQTRAMPYFSHRAKMFGVVARASSTSETKQLNASDHTELLNIRKWFADSHCAEDSHTIDRMLQNMSRLTNMEQDLIKRRTVNNVERKDSILKLFAHDPKATLASLKNSNATGSLGEGSFGKGLLPSAESGIAMGKNETIWTIDLVHLLMRMGICCRFYTNTKGVNLTLRDVPFYSSQLLQDRKRVEQLFEDARVPIELRASVEDAVLESALDCGDVAIVLVDQTRLRCQLCGQGGEMGSFVGHYIVVVERSGTEIVYSDPAAIESRCKAPLTMVHYARRARGTDEDLIIISSRQKPIMNSYFSLPL